MRPIPRSSGSGRHSQKELALEPNLVVWGHHRPALVPLIGEQQKEDGCLRPSNVGHKGAG